MLMYQTKCRTVCVSFSAPRMKLGGLNMAAIDIPKISRGFYGP